MRSQVPLYVVTALLFLTRVGGLNLSARVIVAVAVVGTIIEFIPEWRGKLED